MDGTRFDRLVRAWHGAGTRRALLRSLAVFPLGGAGAVLSDPEPSGATRGDAQSHAEPEAAIGDEKRTHKQRCRHRKGKGKGHHGRRKSCKARHGGGRKNKKKQRCTPEPAATTCAGKCGPVTNNCQQTVNCSSCACEPECGECVTCQEQGPNTPGVCVVNPDQQGDDCGQPGQFCQADGSCACDANSCGGDTPVCFDGACICGDICEDGCQFSSVQVAIDAADIGDTITICAGTFTGNITITKNLTLVGAGATTLQGDGAASVLVVEATVTAAIHDLTIFGGNGGEFGGGLSNSGTLEMTGVTVQDNITTTSGGGIVNTGTLQMTGCAVTENTSNIGGGINNRGVLTLTDCTVSENTASNFGGGIFNAGTGAVTLNGGSVNGNEGEGLGGGGIFNSGTVTLQAGAAVTGNHAGGDGGGIYNDDSAGGGTSTCTGGSSVSGNTSGNPPVPDDCFAAPGGSCGTC